MLQAGGQLKISVAVSSRLGWSQTILCEKCALLLDLVVKIDVATRTPASCFDLGEKWSLVPVRFGIVVVRNRIESGPAFARQNVVRDTYDRRGVDSTAEFSNNRRIGAKSALDSIPKGNA